MTTPDQSPSGGDRDAAMSVVDAALASGRIVQADRDMRADQIKNATTMQDIDIVVRDLVGHAPVSAGTPQQPLPLVNYGPTQGQATEVAGLATGTGKKLGGIIAVVVLIAVITPIAGVIIGLVTARDTFDDLSFAEPVDETTYLPGQEPGENGVNVLTEEGYEDLVLAVDEEKGSTQVFSATLYPRYAVVSLPDQATGRRYQSYYWDGRTLVNNDIKSTSDAPRVDLGSVDPAVMITLLDEVRSRIEDPTSWYVSIDSIPTEGPRLAVYTYNEYGETAYLLATLQGEITYESTTE